MKRNNVEDEYSTIEYFKLLVDFKDELLETIERHKSSRTLDAQKFLAFLESFKKVLNLKIEYEEVNLKFDELQRVVTAYSNGNFKDRVDIPNSLTLFASFGLLLNVLGEELEDKVVKTHYINELLKLSTDAVLITDNDGVVTFYNSVASEYLNIPDVAHFRIANIFSSKTKFASPIEDLKGKMEITEYLCPLNRPYFMVNVTITEMLDKDKLRDGYLYVIKKL